MRIFQIILLGMNVAGMCGCLGIAVTDGQHTKDSVDNQNTVNPVKSTLRPEWTQIDLPLEQAETLISNNGEIYVVGIDGVVKIAMNFSLHKLKPPSQVDEVFSKDGGLSPIHVDNKTEPTEHFNIAHICSSESAVVFNNRLYAVGPCEHTGQLRSFSLDGNENEKSFLLGFTYSTYPRSDTEDPVYGPDSVVKVVDRIIFPSSLKNGPAILEMSEGGSTLKIVWQGQKSDGVILSTDFIGKEGVMLTSKGQLLRSYDGGSSWRLFSEVPRAFVGKVWEVRLRNLNEAYIIGGSGIVLHSLDTGKTWKRQESNIKGSLYKIVADNRNAVILADFKSLILSDNAKTWKKLDFANDERIDDILLHNGKLFVLSGSKLYVH